MSLAEFVIVQVFLVAGIYITRYCTLFLHGTHRCKYTTTCDNNNLRENW